VVAGTLLVVSMSPALGEARPAPTPALAEEITVTATGVESRLAEVPAAVTVLDAEDLAAAPGLALDDVLRQVPGFTLFRRSGSRTANPTTQGPSLRGVGGSGASRALVLGDGIPLNDPFGGWVAWGRVPRLALQQVEVLRGGASDLYGTGALAGVVQLLRRPITPGAWAAEGSAGNESTASADLWSAARRSAWGGALAAERVTTAGAVPVARDERGAVDVAAGGHHTSAELTVERAPPADASAAGTFANSRLFARGGSFEERRANGTPQQTNSTWLREAALGADVPALGGDAALRLWATRERYFQTFSVVAADRDSEVMNRDQRVPSRVRGASGRWRRSLGGSTTLLAGIEARRTRGESDERLFTAGRIVPSSSGGRQDLDGAYVETLLAPARRWSFAAGLRGDGWRNVSNPGSGGAPGVRTRRDAQALSPRLSARCQASEAWSLDLAGYRSFRAPTLNELYRGFRVGNAVTDPNPRLGPERLRGAELGIGWMPRSATGGANARLRASLFSMDLEDTIANVTISTTPELVRRRRENLGRTRARGAELEGEAQPWRRLTVAGSWLLVDSTVRSFAADPALAGKRVPQVPRAQASLSFGWHGDAATATLAARWSASSFEDDRNTAALDRFTLVDAEVAHGLRRGLTAFVAVENLLDEEYVVGRAGVTTVGTPRLVRVGIRLARGGA
jgi:outer membrane receptor protein involved in Fe transport